MTPKQKIIAGIAALSLGASLATAAAPEPKVSVPKDIKQLATLVKSNAGYTFSFAGRERLHRLSYVTHTQKGYVYTNIDYVDRGQNGPDNVIDSKDSIRMYSIPIPDVRVRDTKHLGRIVMRSELERTLSSAGINLNEGMQQNCYSDNNIDGYADPCLINEPSTSPVKTGVNYTKFDTGYHQDIAKAINTIKGREYARIFIDTLK